ncbi:HAMP domain-containing sensor histidine kinase [Croceibacter atlanticus]|uniref:sensor histidine kinase n=1 Tax=Croceibacter atlanticus TaxID=313588 RepID=UPI0030F5E04F
MNFSNERNIQRWLILVSALVFIGLIFFNASLFFQQLKNDERNKMRIWAMALEEFISFDIDNPNDGANLDLVTEIVTSNVTIPSINTDGNGNIMQSANISEEDESNPDRMQRILLEMKSENDPIKVNLGDGEIQYVYYGNSPTLNRLKYYPLALIVFLLLLIGVIYFFYRTARSSEQNKLWAGMAKETAHQIGTPLSSLVGWTEILKTEQVNPEYIEEIEKDIERLKVITDRFSKVGSKPTLSKVDIVKVTEETFGYLKNRSSKLIEFKSEIPNSSIEVMLNEPLFSWTIENLVKNAIDAMKGKGQLSLRLIEDQKVVKIEISDTGKGIPKSKFKKVFETGYTSKKRGWGLGLSFAKRIIEEYHNGNIKVLKSDLGKGTTFGIKLRKV